MSGVAIQEAIDEIPADSVPFDVAQGGPIDGAQGRVATDDLTPPEEMDRQAVSPRQRLALEAFCKGGTIGDAAKAANVSRQTLHRWRAKYPHFAMAMSSWNSACLSMAESQMAELASRAVGALANAIDKGDARSAMAVLRSLGVLRTYQPSKAPAGNAEKSLAVPGMDLLGQAMTEAAPESRLAGKPGAVRQENETVAEVPANAPPAAGKVVAPAATNSGGTAVKPESTEIRRAVCEPAETWRRPNLISTPGNGGKPALLARKAGSAIKKACDNALPDVTEC